MNKVNEKSITNSILRYANKHRNVWLMKRHGGGYGNNGQPDIYGAINGRHVEIEIKAPNGQPTNLQRINVVKWKSIGVVAGIVWSLDGFKKLLEQNDVKMEAL